MKFLDFEHDIIITEKELLESYNELFANNETDCETFREYVRECTGKNGILEIIQ